MRTWPYRGTLGFTVLPRSLLANGMPIASFSCYGEILLVAVDNPRAHNREFLHEDKG
jgi:hypothetical protein